MNLKNDYNIQINVKLLLEEKRREGGSDFDGQSFQCNSCPDHWSCLTCPVARDNKFYS